MPRAPTSSMRSRQTSGYCLFQTGFPRFTWRGEVEAPVIAPAPPPITAPVATPTGPPTSPTVAPVAAPAAAPPCTLPGSRQPQAASSVIAPIRITFVVVFMVASLIIGRGTRAITAVRIVLIEFTL